jgi:amidase
MRAASRAATRNIQQYFKTLRRRELLSIALERFLSQYDAWLCPVSATPAFTHRTPGPRESIDVDGHPLPMFTANGVYTSIFNMTGHPVVVVPLALSQEGLPIGIQVVGPLWSEMALLNVAEILSEVIGPFRRPPGY